MLRIIVVFLSIITISGCAANLTTFDSKGKKSKGIPVVGPVLVKITSVTEYQVLPGPKHKHFEDHCMKETKSEYKILPLDIYYVELEPSPFGKGEFKIEFTDSGAPKMISLNSDASAGIDAVKGFLETTLPFVTDVKTLKETTSRSAVKNVIEDLATGQMVDAATLKKIHCLKKGSVVKSIEKVKIKQ